MVEESRLKKPVCSGGGRGKTYYQQPDARLTGMGTMHFSWGGGVLKDHTYRFESDRSVQFKVKPLAVVPRRVSDGDLSSQNTRNLHIDPHTSEGLSRDG